MRRFLGGIYFGVLIALWGCGDELEGPEELVFEGIDVLSMDVERGEVSLFGSDTSELVAFHRWQSPSAGFSRLEERREGVTLTIEGHCKSGENCRLHYDGTLRRTARVDVQVGEGKLEIMRLTGPTRVVVGKGSIRGGALTMQNLDVKLEEGRADLTFDEPPRRLRLEVGEQAEMVVIVPDVRFRCDFDRDAEAISLNELQCHGLVEEEITIVPPDGRVRFEVKK